MVKKHEFERLFITVHPSGRNLIQLTLTFTSVNKQQTFISSLSRVLPPLFLNVFRARGSESSARRFSVVSAKFAPV